MKILIVTAAILLGGAAFPATANAQQGDAPESITVRWNDLDLGTGRGVRELKRRIHYASRRICGDPASRSIHDQIAARECRDEAARSAEESHARAIAQALGSKRQNTELANMVPLKSK